MAFSGENFISSYIEYTIFLLFLFFGLRACVGITTYIAGVVRILQDLHRVLLVQFDQLQDLGQQRHDVNIEYGQDFI